jgi:hypothetical protein
MATAKWTNKNQKRGATMTIQREDLVAAAALGLVQHQQVDPLFVYLLQRDLLARRLAFATACARRNGVYAVVTYATGLLAAVTIGLFALLFLTRGSGTGAGLMLLYLGAYFAGIVVLLVWCRVRGAARWLRLLSLALMASVPFAVFALH